jgi:hypothetical protein
MSGSWKQLGVVAASALAVVIAADVGLGRLQPPTQVREVEDGIADFERADPDTLVLGSSHARTLHALGIELSRRTQGARTLVAVPVENGKLIPYSWVLENRLKPIIEAHDAAAGGADKTRLRRFVLITEWWDTCPHDNNSPYWNLPARAWTAGDFLGDVADHGVTGFNRNYLQNRMRRVLSHSALVYDRTQQGLIPKISDVLHGRPVGPMHQDLPGWHRMIERGVNCIGDPAQMQALARIADYAAERRWEMTILLFPRKPLTLTEKARATTLPKFAQLMRDFAAPRNIRVIDLTTTTPMNDDDFMEDFDHINQEGNKKFAAWALEHDFRFLITPPNASSTLAATRGTP